MVLLKITFDLSDETYGNDGALDAAMIEGMFPREHAEEMALLPGLKWKLWTIQPKECRAAGFYLFQTEADAEARAIYAKKHFPKVPGLTNVSAEFYDVIDGLSRITKAPIDLPSNPSIVQ